MERGILKKESLNRLFDTAARERRVVVPVLEERTGEYTLGEYVPEASSGSGDKNLPPGPGYITPRLSAKGVFFPQTEILCRYEDGVLTEETLPDEKILLFGIRPCDARAIAELDEIFAASNSRFEDPYYLKRRENSVVVALACMGNEAGQAAPARTCFCTSVGGDPAGREGSDVIAYDLGERYLFTAVTGKGSEFLDANSGIFEKADDKELDEAAEAAEKVVEAARESMETIDLESIKERLDESFDSEVWKEITERCIGCGACTYLCPTCHCFDITDEDNGHGKGRRIRTWDSCQYPQFTLHASGHNPRNVKTQRMRQRVMHKFSYAVENNGNIYCVGCGRCVARCPVNLDIREVLKIFTPVVQE
ncbi:MAG: 4Fe-4S dicluster domain-containing protein [Spirochaetia bacterium]